MRVQRLLATAFLAAGALPAFAADPVPIAAPVPPAKTKDVGPADEKAVRALLKDGPKLPGGGDGIPLGELLQIIAKEHNLTIRLDLAAFKRFNASEGQGNVLGAGAGAVFISRNANANPEEIKQMYDVKIRYTVSATYSLGDLLTDACAQLPGRCAYRIRHNQVLIGPAFLPAVTPGAGATGGEGGQLNIAPNVLTEQLLGESVSVAIEEQPLTAAIAELRKITGANIVLDARAKDKAKQAVSGTFDDARLFTALELLADMCDLKVVSNNNVFYITAPDNAAKMQKRIHADLFGEPVPPQPPQPMPNATVPPGKDDPKK